MKDKLKILFVIRSTELFHYYKSIVGSLCSRGNDVLVLFDWKWSKGLSLDKMDRSGCLTARYDWAIRRRDRWWRILFYTRSLLNYRRYLVLGTDTQSTFYKDRWEYSFEKLVHPYFFKIIKWGVIQFLIKSSISGRFLRLVERIAPASPEIVNHIHQYSPDAVIAGPIDLRHFSSDLEYLKAAVKLNIPSAAPVLSWDNLTTKELFHIIPTKLLAWNDIQVEEAITHHSIPFERISVIGAPLFDCWFSVSFLPLGRSEFCQKYGLRSSDPIITYLGSSHHLAGDETWIVKRLRKLLDESADSLLRRIQIIVRPHGANSEIYQNLGLSNVVIIPQKGTLPDTKDSLRLFYDTLYHSAAAVVGVNTSAIIDAMIVGKPGIAILTEEYNKTQLETAHFRQLVEADALRWVKDFNDFTAAISEILNNQDKCRLKREAFIKKYIRPWGLDRSAGDVAADEIEKLCRRN